MNIPVLVFFVHNVLATLLLGGKFVSRGGAVFKNFGIALLIDAVAFAIWSVAIVTRPDNLQDYVSLGTAVFIISLLFLLRAGTESMAAGARNAILVLGVVIGAGIFYTGSMAAYPSLPAFSPDGFFFFNVHPLLQALYVLALALTAFPAIDALCAKFRGGYASLVRYGFVAAAAGGMILVTSTSAVVSEVALYLTGAVIGITYLVLWTTLLLSKKAWA